MLEKAVAQTAAVLTVLLLSPLLKGTIDKLKARVQSRRGASPLQPYYDLAKLFRKQRTVTPEASLVFRAAPYLAFAAPIAFAVLIPVLTATPPTWAFFATGNLLLRFRTRTIGSVAGLVRDMPATAIVLIAGALAIAGAPPFNLFVSEFSIVAGAAASRQWVPALAVAALLVVGFLAIVWPFNRMAFSTASPGSGRGPAVNAVALLPAYLTLAVVIVLGFWVPSPLQALLSGAARSVLP